MCSLVPWPFDTGLHCGNFKAVSLMMGTRTSITNVSTCIYFSFGTIFSIVFCSICVTLHASLKKKKTWRKLKRKNKGFNLAHQVLVFSQVWAESGLFRVSSNALGRVQTFSSELKRTGCTLHCHAAYVFAIYTVVQTIRAGAVSCAAQTVPTSPEFVRFLSLYKLYRTTWVIHNGD